MANKGRIYAEGLVGDLDRSAYNQQRDVAQNVYNTNWQNVQNQYRNLQDKLKLQQQRANAEYAEGLINVAENAFNRERTGSGNLANRGLSASGLTNILNQADTAQKGEEISKLLKKSGGTSLETADKLGQATTKFADEGTGLMGKLANTLGDIGDAETAMQNRYNQTLASIAGAMDEREMNNALQAAQRELQKASMRASSASSGRSAELKSLQDQLEEAHKKDGINKVLSSNDLTDVQKANYLGIMFGINDPGKVVNAYNSNLTATADYNKKLAELENAAYKERVQNRKDLKATQDYFKKQQKAAEIASRPHKLVYGSDFYNDVNTLNNINRNAYTPASYTNQIALQDFRNKGITYEDLAALLYGSR